jgi:hypothetical protein
LGYDPANPNALSSHYTFPGESDPLFAGTDGLDPNYPLTGGWTEANENNEGGDRRMIGSSGPFTFEPGDVQYIDLAYIFARESHDEDETVFETLQRYADEVEGMHCEPLPDILLSNEIKKDKKFFRAYPNPTNNQFTVDINLASSHEVTIDMVNVVGQVVKTLDLGTRSSGLNREYIDVNDLPQGLYFMNITIGDSQGTIRVQVTR